MKTLQQRIDQIVPELRQFRRFLHKRPEPAFEEFETAAAVAERLKFLPGMQVLEGVGGTGVVALLGEEKQGPCLALRADMDCLSLQEENTFAHASEKPGLMHACGHDGHTACLLGAATVLAGMDDVLDGPVKFLFQPAEENRGGAARMVAEGVLEAPAVHAIYGLHGTTAIELGGVGLRSGPAMAASRYFTITVRGRGCHAASPHRGIDPVLIGSHIVCAVQAIITRNIDPLDSCVISIPKFSGSTAPNVIPERVVLEGTLRALTNEARERLEKRLAETVTHTAEAFGGQAEIDYWGGYPLLVNDEGESLYVRGMAEALLGRENVIWGYPPSLGAEDFAYYAERVPAAFFWLGLQAKGETVPPLHHPRFDFNDMVIPQAVRLLSELALGYWTR